MLRKMSHLGSRQAWQTPLLLTYEDRQNEGWQSGSEFPKSLATPPANQAEAQLSHELMSPSGTHIHTQVCGPGYWYLPSPREQWGLPAWLHGTSPNKQARGC